MVWLVVDSMGSYMFADISSSAGVLMPIISSQVQTLMMSTSNDTAVMEQNKQKVCTLVCGNNKTIVLSLLFTRLSLIVELFWHPMFWNY